MDTFKFWLIANFEIVIFVLALIIGSIIFWGFGGGFENENASAGFLCVLLMPLMNVPSKRGVLQFGKYILMLAAAIILTVGVRENGWITDIEGKALLISCVSWFWIVFSIATVASIFLAIYTYTNIDEVISLRMLYRNSDVALFEFSWLYTLDRFCSITVSIVICVLSLVVLIKLILL